MPSTHAVLVTGASLSSATDGPMARLQIWDFGGQDIYHGTHALFMRASAIFLLAWTPALEDAGKHVHDGMASQSSSRLLGGLRPPPRWRGSPVLVVQARCDRPEDDAICPVPEADLFQAFAFRRVLRYSPGKDRGRAALEEALAEAAAWLRQREGIAVIGAAWYGYSRSWRQCGTPTSLTLEARQYRTITQAHFRRLCEEAGGISSPDHLLAYLHNAGVVFYRPGLFHDDIILDQGWALDAIYAVFHREKCYGRIRRRKGRFTRSELEDWVARAQRRGTEAVPQHDAIVRHLFRASSLRAGERKARPSISRRSAARPRRDRGRTRTEVGHGSAQRGHDVRVRDAASRPDAQRHLADRRRGRHSRRVLEGRRLRLEMETRSRGLIEEEMVDTWRGRIRVQTQSGQAAVLLQRLRAIVEEEQNRAGMISCRSAPPPIDGTAVDEMLAAGPRGEAASAALSFGQEPSPAPGVVCLVCVERRHAGRTGTDGHRRWLVRQS